MSMETSQKEKTADPSLKDCANCGTAGAKLTCAKCKATHYCSKACQKQHWKNYHKAQCVTPEERRPNMTPLEADAKNREPAGNNGECPICLDTFAGGTLCTLPCKHEFHRDCVEELRKQGVQQACPLCRSVLPPGPEQLFEEASRMYVRMAAQCRALECCWKPRTSSEKKIMARVLELWTNAADQGHIRANHHIGIIYASGSGVAQDYKTAMLWYRKAADQGFADAQFTIGSMYKKGEGVAQDHKEAARWTRKAADQGHDNAQNSLGKMYHEGKGVAQDYTEAVRWFRKAARQGLANAQGNLGDSHREGLGVSQDDKKALELYRKAADQGVAISQYNVGAMYSNGKGVAQDSNEAVRWYRKAADQGFAHAQVNLAAMYRTGDGVAQDYNEAVRWFRRASDQGNVFAQLRLGTMHYEGNGVTQDLKAALVFFSAAEAQGHNTAHELRKQVEAELELRQTRIARLMSSECSGLNAPSPSKCTCCGRDADNAVKLKPCPRCKGPLYCGKECQSEHWKNVHRERCT